MNERNKISETDIKELKTTALRNREHILYRTIIPEINGNKRNPLRIAGVGQKAIRLDTYLNYESILKYSDSGSLEEEMKKIINTVY